MATTEPSEKRGPLIGIGVVVIVVALVGGLLLWLAAGSRRSDAVEKFARAPVGCDTTLDFDEAGEYLIFVETRGRIDEVRGDCDATGEYELSVDEPDVSISVVDPDGADVDLSTRRDAVTYSVGDYAGRSVLALDVAEAADHVMRVQSSDDATFAVAIGRDPNGGVGALRGAAVTIAGLGLLLGGGLLVLGVRRRPQKIPAGAWAPTATPSPTGRPPYVAPVQAPYGIPGQPPMSPEGRVGYGSEQPRAPRPPAYGQPGQATLSGSGGPATAPSGQWETVQPDPSWPPLQRTPEPSPRPEPPARQSPPRFVPRPPRWGESAPPASVDRRPPTSAPAPQPFAPPVGPPLASPTAGSVPSGGDDVPPPPPPPAKGRFRPRNFPGRTDPPPPPS